MPFILLIIALFLPRVVIALLWFSTDWFTGIVPHWMLGILGFLFLPYTLLWFTAVQHWYGGAWGTFQVIVLILAVIADIGIPGRSRYRR